MLTGGKFCMLKVDDLVLDIDNPRIKKWIEFYGEAPSAAQIRLALGVGTGDEQSENGTTYNSLKESIRASGGINHPIIVNDDEGRKTVIEGNTRLAIYQEFRDSEVPGEWDEIPCMVFKNLELKNIDAIRLQSHLVGPRAWDPYSKAKYLDHLYNETHMTVDMIIAYCGGKQKDIQNYIDAFRDMEQYYRPILESDQDFDTTRFSGFVELQRPQVKEAILRAGKDISDFAEWIDKKKIHPLSTVRQLPKILGNEEAKETFYRSGAREALKSLDTPNVENVLSNTSLSELCRALQRSIDNLQYPVFREMLSNDDDPQRLAVLDLKDSFIQLVKDLEDD